MAATTDQARAWLRSELLHLAKHEPELLRHLVAGVESSAIDAMGQGSSGSLDGGSGGEDAASSAGGDGQDAGGAASAAGEDSAAGGAGGGEDGGASSGAGGEDFAGSSGAAGEDGGASSGAGGEDFAGSSGAAGEDGGGSAGGFGEDGGSSGGAAGEDGGFGSGAGAEDGGAGSGGFGEDGGSSGGAAGEDGGFGSGAGAEDGGGIDLGGGEDGGSLDGDGGGDSGSPVGFNVNSNGAIIGKGLEIPETTVLSNTADPPSSVSWQDQADQTIRAFIQGNTSGTPGTAGETHQLLIASALSGGAGLVAVFRLQVNPNSTTAGLKAFITLQTGTHNQTLLADDGTSDWLQKANNLSEIAAPATALTNLGGLAKANNLSDVANQTTTRTNLGFGSGSRMHLATATTLVAGTVTTVPFDTVDFDGAGNLVIASHEFKAPAAGLYLVCYAVGVNTPAQASGGVLVEILKNGTAASRGARLPQEVATAATVNVSGADILQLAANDLLTLAVQWLGTTNASFEIPTPNSMQNYLSVIRVA